jgi:hypothetical protein
MGSVYQTVLIGLTVVLGNFLHDIRRLYLQLGVRTMLQPWCSQGEVQECAVSRHNTGPTVLILTYLFTQYLNKLATNLALQTEASIYFCPTTWSHVPRYIIYGYTGCKEVCCEGCVFSGRGLWDELITCSEESYRLGCVGVWSRNLVKEDAVAHWGFRAKNKQYRIWI